jgi:hypothetical protein
MKRILKTAQRYHPASTRCKGLPTIECKRSIHVSPRTQSKYLKLLLQSRIARLAAQPEGRRQKGGGGLLKIRAFDFKPASTSYNFRTMQRQIEASIASNFFVQARHDTANACTIKHRDKPSQNSEQSIIKILYE